MSDATLSARIESRAKFACVVKAINARSPSGRQGKRSKCWAMDATTQHRVAELVCIEHATLDAVLKELKTELKGIDRSSLNRWLKPIVEAYRVELNRASLHDEASLDVAVHDGDLVAQMSVVWGAAMIALAKYIKSMDWNDIDNTTKHTLLRFLEASTDAAKVQAQAKEHEAKTQRILIQVRSLLAAAEGTTKSVDRAAAMAKVAEKLDELLGIKAVAA